MKIAIGVDIGGSHITSAGINLETYTLIPETYYSSAINNKASKEVILEGWATILNKTVFNIRDQEILGIGCAIPGPFEYKLGIALYEGNDKYESLYGTSITEVLPKYLTNSEIPLRFLNDASAFGVGGTLLGSTKNKKKVIAITLGTGFGASFISDYLPLTQGVGVPEDGCLWNEPFLNGIADEYFSTRWFVSSYESKSGKTFKGGVKEMMERKDEHIVSIFKEFSHNFCVFMFSYIKDFDAELIIIGGNIAKSHSLFLNQIIKNWEEMGLNIPISIINKTDEASIVGSAYLFDNIFWREIKNKLPNV